MLTGHLGRGVNALRPPWGLLGLSAGGSLLFRGATDVLWVRLTNVLDSLLGPVAVAAITLRPSPLLLVGVALEWFMLLYLLHNRLPRIIGSREEMPGMLLKKRFRYVLLVVVLGMALLVATNVPSPVGPSPLHKSGILVWALLLLMSGYFGLVAYIWANMNGRPPSEWLAFLENAFPFDVREDFGEEGIEEFLRDDWVGGSHRFGWICVVVPVYLSLVCCLLGIVAGIASLLFPMPELVVLAVAGNNLVASRWDGAPVTPLKGAGLDIETRLYRLVRYPILEQTGMATLLFVGAVVAAMVFAYVSVVALLGIVHSLPLLAVTAAEAPVRVWNAVGYAACLIAPGLYGLWFWYRTLLRFPYLLTYWSLRNRGTTALSLDNRLPRLVARPRDALLTPTLVWGVAMLFAWQVDEPELLLVGTEVCDNVVCLGGGLFGTLWQYPLFDWPFGTLAAETLLQFPGTEMLLFAVGWPVLLAGLPLSIWLTRRSDVQHPLTDKHVIVFAFLLQLSWLWLLITVARIPGFLVEGALGLFIPLVVGTYYLYDLEYGTLRERVAAGTMAGGVLLLVLWSYGVGYIFILTAIVPLLSLLAAMGGLRHVGADAESPGCRLPAVLIVAGLLGMTAPIVWFWIIGRMLQMNLFIGWLSVGLLFPFLDQLVTTDREIGDRRTTAGGIGLGLTGIAFVSPRLWDAIEVPGSNDTSLLEFVGGIGPLQGQVYLFFFMIGFLSVAMLGSWLASVLYPAREDTE